MDNRQNHYIQELLDLLSNPNYRQQHQSGIAGPNGIRFTDQVIDDTEIDDRNHTRVNNSDVHSILDCGHCSTQQVGGRCRFCDALVCRQCIYICFSCGLPACPSCSTISNFDGQARLYCRMCNEEIVRALRLRHMKDVALSFFIE